MNVMNAFSFRTSLALKEISWMSVIDLEEVSGTIIIRNRTFSAKDVLQAIIQEAIPVEFRDGTLAIGIERIFPKTITNVRAHPSQQREECPLLIQEIAQIKHSIRQIKVALQLGNREVEQSGSAEKMGLTQLFGPESSASKKRYTNRAHEHNPAPPVPFPESNNEKPFEFLRDPDEPTTTNGFLRSQSKCKKCGQILPEPAKFCNVCGFPTAGSNSSHAPQKDRENSIIRPESSRRRF